MASETGSMIDVAAELLIHMERKVVTPMMPAIDLKNSSECLDSFEELLYSILCAAR